MTALSSDAPYVRMVRPKAGCKAGIGALAPVARSLQRFAGKLSPRPPAGGDCCDVQCEQDMGLPAQYVTPTPRSAVRGVGVTWTILNDCGGGAGPKLL